MTLVSNSSFIDALIRHQVFLTGYANYVSSDLQKTLGASMHQIREYLAVQLVSNDKDTQTAKKLTEMERRVTEIRKAAWATILEDLDSEASSAIAYEPEFLRMAVGDPQSWSAPDTETATNLPDKTLIVGRTLRDNIKQLAKSDMGRLIVQLRIGYMGRQTASKLLTSLKVPAQRSLNALDTITESSILVLSSAARELAARANPGVFSDKELWVSILDKATTDGCRNLNGKIFDVGQGPKVGYHFGCRSDRVPLLAGLGVPSDSMPSIPNFSAWLATQGPKFRSFLRKSKGQFNKRDVQGITLRQVGQLNLESSKEMQS